MLGSAGKCPKCGEILTVPDKMPKEDHAARVMGSSEVSTKLKDNRLLQHYGWEMLAVSIVCVSVVSMLIYYYLMPSFTKTTVAPKPEIARKPNLDTRQSSDNTESEAFRKIKIDYLTHKFSILNALKSLINKKKFTEAEFILNKYSALSEQEEFKELKGIQKLLKAEKELKILEDLLGVSENDYSKNLELYSELLQVNPQNTLYKQKTTYYKEKILYEKVKRVPASDYETNYRMYVKLSHLNQQSELYKRKVDHYRGKMLVKNQKLSRPRYVYSDSLTDRQKKGTYCLWNEGCYGT